MRTPPQPVSTTDVLERAFAASAGAAFVGALVAGCLIHAGYGPRALWTVMCLSLLASVVVGSWTLGRVDRAQRADVARVYTAALNGRRDVLVERSAAPTRAESLAQCLRDMIQAVKLATLGRDNLAVAMTGVWRGIAASRERGDAVALHISEDAHAIAMAAQASQEVERVYSNCWQNVRETTVRVEGVTDRLVIEAEGLAQSIRVVTAQVDACTGVAAQLADTAFATQNFVVGIGQATRAMQASAEELHHMMQRTEMAALNAGIEAAHAGDSACGFAVVATEMKQLARTGGTALGQMLVVVGELKQQTGALCERVQQIGEAVQAQHEFGHALSHAAMLQADAVGRVIRQIEAAHGEVRALKAQMRDPALPALRLGVSPSARQAVERLPGYADAMADILRGLPDLSTIERTREST